MGSWFVFEPHTNNAIDNKSLKLDQSKGQQKKKDKHADFYLLCEDSVVVASMVSAFFITRVLNDDR